jgi:hypothetical protein
MLGSAGVAICWPRIAYSSLLGIIGNMLIMLRYMPGLAVCPYKKDELSVSESQFDFHCVSISKLD